MRPSFRTLTALLVQSAIQTLPAQSGTAPRGAPRPDTSVYVPLVEAFTTSTMLVVWSVSEIYGRCGK